MIYATIDFGIFPGGPKVIVNDMPKEGESISVQGYGDMREIMLTKRWDTTTLLLKVSMMVKKDLMDTLK